MKISGLTVTFVVVVLLACAALLGRAENGSLHAQQLPPAPERPLVFVPGLLGSMLCRPGPQGEQTVVWGTVDAMGQFPTLAVDRKNNDVVPCGLIREVSF